MKPKKPLPSVEASPDLHLTPSTRQCSSRSLPNFGEEAFFRELYAAEVATQRCQQSAEHQRIARRIFDFLRDKA